MRYRPSGSQNKDDVDTWRTYSFLIPALLGCHHPKEDPHSVEPRGTRTGALVGAVYDCGGHPVPSVGLSARRYETDAERAADSLTQLVNSTFAVNSLRPGKWELTFRAIGYTARSVPVTITSGATETLTVRLSESPAVIGDCVCANGEFGSHCCKPVPTRPCDDP
jgi:hypothetical protein